jgi:hypothetical protein
MNRLGNAVRVTVAAAVFVLPVAAAAVATAAVPTTAPTIEPVMNVADPTCCTGTPWGEITEPPV